MKQVFLPVGWYDAIPLHAFAQAIAQSEERSVEEFLHERTIQAVRTDLTGM